jgi:hypothetical protein
MDYSIGFAPEEVKTTDELPFSNADKEKLFQSKAEGSFCWTAEAGRRRNE